MDYKSRTREFLLQYYNANGYKQTVETAIEMLKADVRKSKVKTFASDLHGEIAEVVLECAIMESAGSNGWNKGDWRLEKSLILKDIDSQNVDFYTEVDLVLFTPNQIVAFEAKSYQGDKTLSGKGTLTSTHGKVDVYRQHSQHMEVLIGNFDSFRIKGYKPFKAYSMYMFDFSIGDILDKREDAYRNLMPLLQIKDIPRLMASLKGEKVWNMRAIDRALSLIKKNEAQNRANHLKYVRGINRGDK